MPMINATDNFTDLGRKLNLVNWNWFHSAEALCDLSFPLQPHAVITLRCVLPAPHGCLQSMVSVQLLSWAFHANLPSAEAYISLWLWRTIIWQEAFFFMVPFKDILLTLLLVVHEFSSRWVKRGVLNFSLGDICCLGKEVAAATFLIFPFTLQQLVCSPCLSLLISRGVYGNISCHFSLQMLYPREHLLQLSPASQQLNKDTLRSRAVIG